jgi:hypothetical protein|tara:strand:- start:1582 stop:1983 length:402 start_codon:yes stop_codon:yes gene_type:complete
MESTKSDKLGKLVKAYIKIRDLRAEISSKFKDEDDGLRGQQDTIKAALLTHCKDHEIESVRTSEGMFYRSTKRRYWTSDWESMHSFILKNETPEFLEKRLNQTAVKQFLEENPEVLPPGLNVESEYTVSVRKK